MKLHFVCFTLALLVSGTSFAQESLSERQANIKGWIDNSLKKSLITLVRSLNPNSIRGSFGIDYRKMVPGLVSDIEKTNYETVNAYVFDNKNQLRTAIVLENGNIRFSLKMLDEIKVSYRELMELGLHEHSRHFEDVFDEENQLGSVILDAYLSVYPSLQAGNALEQGVEPSQQEVKLHFLTLGERVLLKQFYLFYRNPNQMVLSKKVSFEAFCLEVLKDSSLASIFKNFGTKFNYIAYSSPSFGEMRGYQVADYLWQLGYTLPKSVEAKLRDGKQSLWQIMQQILREQQYLH